MAAKTVSGAFGALEPRAVLKRCFGYDFFRPNQEQIVDALLEGRDVLAVMPTGAGKSVCYQVPALCLAERAKAGILPREPRKGFYKLYTDRALSAMKGAGLE